MPPMSPTVASWELNLRLKARRVEIGMDVAVICKTLGFTRNYWSAVENDRKILAADKLDKLLDLLEYDQDEKRELANLREEAKNRGWWTNYSGLLSAELLRLYGFEHGAESIRTYESLLIPGLLQTADYARALMSPDIAVRPSEIDQRIELRLKRQERLDGENPLELNALISEAALRQHVGGPAVLRDQLRHLEQTVTTHDAVSVRIIPFTATNCGLFGASTFHLIDFNSTRLPTVAWQETVTASGILDTKSQIRDLRAAYAAAVPQSLDDEDSLRLIRRCANELA